MKTIGFIGLGIMGHAMAAHLQNAGYHLVLYNRTPEKANDLVAGGAELAGSPAAVAEKVDTVFTMLSTPEVVEDVAWGKEGFVEILENDALWIDCSTVNPSFSKEMAQEALSRKVRFIDAPVAGSKVPAEKAELVFLVGGRDVDVEEARPMLEVMGKKVLHMGEYGQGAALKMVFNYCLGMSMVAFTEAITLGTGLGLDREQVIDIIANSPVMAPNVGLKKDKILNSEYSPEFPLKWLQKDMHLATLTGYQHKVPMPAGNVVKELYQMAQAGGHGDKDFSAIFGFLQELAGQK